MSGKKVEEAEDLREEKKADEPAYSDVEVTRIMLMQQRIYSLDDAIATQTQIQRPASYIDPLKELRNECATELRVHTQKFKIVVPE
jgi:hypothetical protein